MANKVFIWHPFRLHVLVYSKLDNIGRKLILSIVQTKRYIIIGDYK